MRMSSVGRHPSDMVAVGTSHVSVGHVRVGRRVVTKITRIPAGMMMTEHQGRKCEWMRHEQSERVEVGERREEEREERRQVPIYENRVIGR
jgi:hypothetical protein